MRLSWLIKRIWMNKWMNEWMNDEWMNEWMNEWWMNEWMNEWMNKWVNRQIRQCRELRRLADHQCSICILYRFTGEWWKIFVEEIHETAMCETDVFGVSPASLRAPHSSFADQTESKMRQRCQVAARADRSFLWHPRQTRLCTQARQRI